MDFLVLSAFLSGNKIPLHLWGKGRAKTPLDLARELERGDCALECRSGSIVRKIRPVMVCIDGLDLSGAHVALKETGRMFADGRDAGRPLPASAAEKMAMDEDPLAGAIRALEEELKIELTAEDHKLVLGSGVPEIIAEEDSWTFPGLPCEMARYWFSFSMPPRLFREQYVEEQPDKTTVFSWVPFDERPWKDIAYLK
jgi:hypothetical protein